MLVESLPLTPSGKVDRLALGRLPTGPLAPEDADGPSGWLEETIATLWSSVLGVERVPRRASFFELGGHSLLAARVCSRLRDVLGVEVPVRAIFDAPTPERLAVELGVLLRAGAPVRPPIVASAPRSVVEVLSFGQERLWFLQELHPNSTAYALTASAWLEGPLVPAALVRALRTVVTRHEVLRTRYPVADGRVSGLVDSPDVVELRTVDLGGVGDASAIVSLSLIHIYEPTRPY